MEFQDTERDLFKRLHSDDQAIALFDMLRAVRGDVANLTRRLVDFQADLTNYRAQREEHEQNTTQKIEAILGKRFDFWTYFRDKVLPSVITVIVVGILYLVFNR